jgi:hypothetical protein
MTEQAMSGGTDPNSVRKVVSVQAPQAAAWQVFTENMAHGGRWQTTKSGRPTQWTR